MSIHRYHKKIAGRGRGKVVKKTKTASEKANPPLPEFAIEGGFINDRTGTQTRAAKRRGARGR